MSTRRQYYNSLTKCWYQEPNPVFVKELYYCFCPQGGRLLLLKTESGWLLNPHTLTAYEDRNTAPGVCGFIEAILFIILQMPISYVLSI